MAWTLAASGPTTISSTSEVTIATDVTNGTYVLQVDTAQMVSGDLLQIRVYTATVTTTSQMWLGSYQHVQTNPIKATPPIASDVSIKCTLTQLAGTKAFEWKLLRI